MSLRSDEITSRVLVGISDDCMEAWISVSLREGDPPFDSEEVNAALEKKGVVINDYVEKRIEAFTPSIESEDEQPERFVIAKGLLPAEGVDGEFTWDESLERVPIDPESDASINYYKLNSMVTVKEDQALGTITLATPGVDGFDACGKVLTPEGTPSEVELDQTVRLADDDSLVVFAKVAGKVIHANRSLSIVEVITINGDVDFETGDIDSTVSVDIHGNIQDLFSVKSAKSITVGGAIEAAEARAKGDVGVRGGILGRAKGAVEADGEIVAKFCDEADLRAQGDISILKEVMNSRVRCDSKLLVDHGVIIGGEAYAREGIEVATLGSEANVPTSITVGIHPEVLRRAAAIDEELKEKREAGALIHQTVKPLLAEIKRLTRTQKKQATELLLKVRGLVAEIHDAQNMRDEILEAGRASGVPFVLVSRIVHLGVSIRIGRRHTVFRRDMKGPIRIEKQKVEGVTEFVALNQLSGSVTVLPSSEVVDPEPEADPEAEN